MANISRPTRHTLGCLPILLLLIAVAPRSIAAGSATELQRLERRLLASPTIQAEPGFRAHVLVPPGQLYDPGWMRSHAGVVWLDDDGGEEGGKGSRILSLDAHGRLTPIADIGTMLPVVGFDVAPQGFGAYAGEIFTLAQARVGFAGATANHVIQRVRVGKHVVADVFCTLPNSGTLNGGVAGYGAAAAFGPEHSPFSGRLFAVTIMNGTIYEITADGQCVPFVTFDARAVGAPLGIAFAQDQATMLVSVSKSDLSGATVVGGGAVVRVHPNGTVEATPVVSGLTMPAGMEFAPKSFGACGGQLFVADAGDFTIPVPMTQPVAQDGKVYRVTADGQPHLVASGFFNPSGVHFVGDALWVTDINGDFIGGRRELPDGFVVEIRADR